MVIIKLEDMAAKTFVFANSAKLRRELHALCKKYFSEEKASDALTQSRLFCELKLKVQMLVLFEYIVLNEEDLDDVWIVEDFDIRSFTRFSVARKRSELIKLDPLQGEDEEVFYVAVQATGDSGEVYYITTYIRDPAVLNKKS